MEQLECSRSARRSLERLPVKTAHDLVMAARQKCHEIATEEAPERIRHADVLIDVREADEYAAGHLPGAIHIPRGVLEFRMNKAPELERRHAKLVLYCLTGGRAALAACALQDMGYLHVQVVAGGYEGWLAAGLPTVKPEAISFD